MGPIGPILFALAIAAFAAPPPSPTTHQDWHQVLLAGPKMEIQRAGFFGAGGIEEFTGVTSLPGGDIVAFGNSWGAPFPDDPKPFVLGTENAVDLPLFPKGLDKDGNGHAIPPPRTASEPDGFRRPVCA